MPHSYFYITFLAARRPSVSVNVNSTKYLFSFQFRNICKFHVTISMTQISISNTNQVLDMLFKCAFCWNCMCYTWLSMYSWELNMIGFNDLISNDSAHYYIFFHAMHGISLLNITDALFKSFVSRSWLASQKQIAGMLTLEILIDYSQCVLLVS